MRQENKEKSSTIYIGKGIIISAIIITASLGFILGFFVGKSFRPNNLEISEKVSNISSQQPEEVVPSSSINQQGNTSSQTTESSNPNSTNATDKQLQSSKTSQTNTSKEQNQKKEESLLQPNQNNKQNNPKTDKSTDTNLSNQNGKSKKYTVQVEAFKNQDAAEELKDKLNKKGYKAVVVSSNKRKDSKLYKVLVGEYSTRKEAEITSIKMRKIEKLQHAFVTFKN